MVYHGQRNRQVLTISVKMVHHVSYIHTHTNIILHNYTSNFQTCILRPVDQTQDLCIPWITHCREQDLSRWRIINIKKDIGLFYKFAVIFFFYFTLVKCVSLRNMTMISVPAFLFSRFLILCNLAFKHKN